MLEFKEIDKPNSIFSNIGRILYCVFAAIPVILFIRLLIDPGETREEKFGDFLAAYLILSLSFIVTIAGVGILILKKYTGSPFRFWVYAVAFAAAPLFCAFIGFFWVTLSTAPPVFGR